MMQLGGSHQGDVVKANAGVMGKWGPPKSGTPSPFYREYGDGDPDFPGKMGIRVPILPGIWGPSRENRDPLGSPFSRYNGDGDPHFTVKIGMGTQL